MSFEGFGDLRMQLLPSTAQQAAVRRVLHERMLETIDGLRRQAALENSSSFCRRSGMSGNSPSWSSPF